MAREVFIRRPTNVFIIAEACDNHLGSVDLAKKMIDAACNAGASAIKFQHHLPDWEMLPTVPKSKNFEINLYDFLKSNALTLEEHHELKSYCDKANIIYLCTPFSYQAAIEIGPIVPFFKIGSGELLDFTSLAPISEINKSMIVSTGMCTYEEVDTAYCFLQDSGCNIALLHCVSEYPPVLEDMNIEVISELKSRYKGSAIGFSDHFQDVVLSVASIGLGATIIEKHVTLDKTIKCPDQLVSIDFDELHLLVEQCDKVYRSLGKEKRIHKDEEQIRSWAHRSIVSVEDINEGDIFTDSNIWTKRPGTGIPSAHFKDIIGRRSNAYIPKNSLISWDHIGS
jgi:N-acetylneuraminate synthase